MLSAVFLLVLTACSPPRGGPDDDTAPPSAGEEEGADGGDDGGSDGGASDAGVDGGPLLTQTPLWSIDGPQFTNECQSATLAVGDVDGDGRADLLLGSEPCPFRSLQPGHVVVHRGASSFFEPTAFNAEMTWTNTSSLTSGRTLRVSIGRVNADSHADVLVSSRYGVQVFAGGPDLTSAFAAPIFRVPGNGLFGSAALADVNGDGFDDLLSSKSGVVTVYVATPSGRAPFEAGRTVMGLSFSSLGDLNDDGAVDVFVQPPGGGAQLFLGCKAGTTLLCDGVLTAQPWWTGTGAAIGMVSDASGDGRRELVVGDSGAGRFWIHASNVDGFESSPTWSLMGDPSFPRIASPIVSVEGLDGSPESVEFIAGALGRLYLLRLPSMAGAALSPLYAWPAEDRLVSNGFGFSRLLPMVDRDRNGDGVTDLLVVAAPSPEDLVMGRGKAFSLPGGSAPTGTPAPQLDERRACAATTAGGKPDLTVDADVLVRTTVIEQREFATTSCEVTEACVGATGRRKLLRFSVSIPNFGNGPAIVPGPSTRPELYQYDSCHEHDHLLGFATYELLDDRGTIVTAGRKQGYFLIDYAPYCMDAQAPDVPMLDGMAINPGWADIYTANLPCQWLDVTSVPDGEYKLRVTVDASNVIEEEDVLPNVREISLRITGDEVQVLP
jgi:Lysyl oxidase/FG-GAP repeat